MSKRMVMSNRMTLAVVIAVFIFILAHVLLLFIYQHSNQLEAVNIEEQLAQNAQLPTDKQLTLTERLDLENQLALKEDWQGQLWSLWGTEAFKIVAISLLLAVILTALGGLFRIDKIIEDRIRAERERRIDAQKECIKLTSEMWNELYCLTSEVRFFKEDGSDKGDRNSKVTIEDILIKLENLTSRADDVINMWYFNFPILHKIEQGKTIQASALFVYLINILYNSSITVAYCIQKKYEKNGDTSLRDSLGVIQDVIESIAHHPIISILKRSVEPLEGYVSKEQERESMDKIRRYLDYLADAVKKIKKFEKDSNVLLPHIKTGEIANFRNEADLFEKWAGEHGNSEASDVWNSAEYKNFAASSEKIGDREFAEAWEIQYSEEYLLKLAHWLGFVIITDDLKARAKLLSPE